MKVTISKKTKMESVSAELSPAQKAYREFFRKKLAEHGGPDALKDTDTAAALFGSISEEWAKHKEENNIQTKS